MTHRRLRPIRASHACYLLHAKSETPRRRLDFLHPEIIRTGLPEGKFTHLRASRQLSLQIYQARISRSSDRYALAWSSHDDAAGCRPVHAQSPKPGQELPSGSLSTQLCDDCSQLCPNTSNMMCQLVLPAHTSFTLGNYRPIRIAKLWGHSQPIWDLINLNGRTAQ